MSTVRINKALAQAGVCSRRKVDELMIQGRVKVNGLIATDLGLKIDPSIDTVMVDNTPVTLMGSEKAPHTYLLLHKPIQVVSTASDPEGRPTVISILPQKYQGKRLFPVGRLDFFSEGLIILTDDGELTHRLTHPRYHLPKVYAVRLREHPDKATLDTMRQGMVLAEGEQLAPVKVELAEDGHTVFMVLKQGINRQIRRMCRDLNLTILSLCRISAGPIELGDLPKGECRELSTVEVKRLRKAVELE